MRSILLPSAQRVRSLRKEGSSPLHLAPGTPLRIYAGTKIVRPRVRRSGSRRGFHVYTEESFHVRKCLL